MNSQRSVIWARCADQSQASLAKTLAARLSEEGEQAQVIVTLPGTGPAAHQHPTGARATRDFLDQATPVLVLWIGGALEPATLLACHAANVPVVVLNGSTGMLENLRSSWISRKQKQAVSLLHSVLAQDLRAVDAFRRAGVPLERVQEAGILEDVGRVLPHHEAERQELASAIGTRPIWLVAGAGSAEAQMIAAAHREASRRAHRLLTIVTPVKQEETAPLADAFRAAGYVTGVRFDGDEPDEAVQIYIAEGAEELGLWYRIAPISFIGGSFDAGASDNPYHAAALGSVVMHGPGFGDHVVEFSRLLEAQAACLVQTPEALGETLSGLLSADRAARLATAGWDVTSRGAEVSDLVFSHVQALLDRVGR